MAAGRIFISHAAADRPLVDALVDLLQTGINVPVERIACTSLEGMKPRPGEDFVQWIRSELQDPCLILSVLTPSFCASQFCLCELGASWAMSHRAVPILVPPTNFDGLATVIRNTQSLEVNSEGDLDALREEVVDALGLENPAKVARWNVKKRAFLKRLKVSLLKKLVIPKAIDPEVHKKLEGELEAASDEMAEQDERISNLEALIEELKGLKNREEVASVFAAYTGEDEAFDKAVEAACEVKELDPALVRALFDTRKGDRPRLEDYDFEDLVDEDLLSRDSGGIVYLNDAHPKVGRATGVLDSLEEALGGLSHEFREAFAQEHDYYPNLNSIRFWQEYLWPRRGLRRKF